MNIYEEKDTEKINEILAAIELLHSLASDYDDFERTNDELEYFKGDCLDGLSRIDGTYIYPVNDDGTYNELWGRPGNLHR